MSENTKVLITAFDAFGGEHINPALEAVKKLPDRIAGAEIVKMELPTVFGKSINKLEQIIAQEKPDVTLCIGQAGGRYAISVERIAINIDDTRIPDNEGNQIVDQPIYSDGPDAYFARLPVKRMVAAIRENNLPAVVSNSAGTFVCNHIMYALLHLVENKGLAMQGGFIHVPLVPEQVLDKNNTPSMSLDDIVKGLTVAIEVVVENQRGQA